MDEETLNVSTVKKLLDQLRSDIVTEISPIKLQLSEHTAGLQILDSERQRTLAGTPKPHKMKSSPGKISHAGLCPTDAQLVDGPGCPEGYVLPCIPGHEGAGTVESIGPGVTRLKPGA
ncbi:hypothetical protein HPB49_002772 [Dermacentor silvarum]|uniref:Uncharacterized protein n=1 Tax=Dermacentor silvarum TaxID=543639 RepID=A0ACB8DA59_DERSI|nr:hypothetical protein HPB49_002772 [Dermacentor silvarum]